MQSAKKRVRYFFLNLMPRFGQPGKSVKNRTYESVAGASPFNSGMGPNLARSSTVLILCLISRKSRTRMFPSLDQALLRSFFFHHPTRHQQKLAPQFSQVLINVHTSVTSISGLRTSRVQLPASTIRGELDNYHNDICIIYRYRY